MSAATEKGSTKIEWTHRRIPQADGSVLALPGYTFNPWRGCAKISEACTFCYAELGAKRNPAVLGQWGPLAPRVEASAAYWRHPETWNRHAERSHYKRLVFCASYADVFEDREDLIPHRVRLWKLIHRTPWLVWLLLTKRPEVAASWAASHGWPGNAWIGATVENQRRAEERIPHLLQIPQAPVRFLSMEPLLGPVDLSHLLRQRVPVSTPGKTIPIHTGQENLLDGLPQLRIDWIITGGESGPRARPSNPAWFRHLRDQAQANGVPYFFKQWGGWREATEEDIHNPAAHAWESRMIDINGKQKPELEAFDGAAGDVLVVNTNDKAANGRLLDGQLYHQMPPIRDEVVA